MGEGGVDVRVREREFSARRRALDDALMGATDRLVGLLGRHWLALVNVVVFVFAFLPFVAPWLASLDGALPQSVAREVYSAYSYTCHQLPQRSWFLFGQQMAYCERDAAIYPAAFVSGLVFAWARGRGGHARLGWRGYFLLIAPMAIDGFTQLFGLRESTWFLRTVTGSLFGAASVWLAYPYLQMAAADLEA
jgi:uncharacterized membrane protein